MNALKLKGHGKDPNIQDFGAFQMVHKELKLEQPFLTLSDTVCGALCPPPLSVSSAPISYTIRKYFC